MEVLKSMLGKCTCCNNTAATICMYILCLLTIVNLPFVEGICYSDSSLRSDDKTSLVAVVVKARIQGRTESGDLQARVTKTLKGDPSVLDKQDIIVTGLAAEGPFRLGSTEPAVAECMQDARPKEKYILFLQETEEENVYSLQFEGVLNSKEELRDLRRFIATENADSSSYNISTTPSNEDNRTAAIESSSSTTSHYVGCPKSGYCLNGGQCAMLIKLKKYFCFCNSPWIGERCQLHDPYLSVDNDGNNGVFFGEHTQNTLITLGIIFGALLLLTIICAVAYVRYKSSYYHDKTARLEQTFKLELSNREITANEQLQPLTRQHQHHQNNNSVNQRYSQPETENVHYPPADSPSNSRLGTRHYSLQPSAPVQPSYSTEHLPRTRSDNSFNNTRTSVV